MGELWGDHTPESLRILERLLNFSPINKLKYNWFIELAHLDRMLDLQDKVGLTLPGFHAQIHRMVLLSIALGKAECAAAAKKDQ
jgi:hypothetical protein